MPAQGRSESNHSWAHDFRDPIRSANRREDVLASGETFFEISPLKVQAFLMPCLLKDLKLFRNTAKDCTYRDLELRYDMATTTLFGGSAECQRRSASRSASRERRGVKHIAAPL